MAVKKKDINITVELDENDIPERIVWDASDMGGSEEATCRAMFLSMWEPQEKDTLKLDLWTREMTIDEMKIFFHQTLVTMADTLTQSTREEEMAEDMRDFCAYFANKMDILE
ncbi:MAG: gliding motility protein GldC [Balneolaceae bacterium]|nr:gliding motility protein GldC [Balneolaceae bacterium]